LGNGSEEQTQGVLIVAITIEEATDLIRTLYYTIPERHIKERKALMKAWEGLEEFNASSKGIVLSTDHMEQLENEEPNVDDIGDEYSHWHNPERAKRRARA
jgi:hypothetical protein